MGNFGVERKREKIFWSIKKLKGRILVWKEKEKGKGKEKKKSMPTN